jgi:hypothetical protein
MGFYQDQVVPMLTSLSMGNKNLAALRLLLARISPRHAPATSA